MNLKYKTPKRSSRRKIPKKVIKRKEVVKREGVIKKEGVQ